jgi:hypothetical protein
MDAETYRTMETYRFLEEISREGVKAGMLPPVTLDSHRHYIEAALAHGAGMYTFEDLQDRVARGEMQFWPGPTSVVITEILEYPRSKTLHCFLAAGNQQELGVMEPAIMEWGRQMGCTTATMHGRVGWERSILTKLGWKAVPMTTLVKQLTAVGDP